MVLPARAPRRARTRFRAAASAVAATALALAGLAVAAPASAAPAAAPAAAAQVDSCPPDGQMPPIGNESTFLDSGIAVYVGGDYLAGGNAAESEGLLVVRGDATFDRQNGGGFDVGTAGVGSGITPAEGEPMLQVGGELVVTAPNTLRVGHLVGGGAVKVGGTATGTIDAAGKPVDTGLGVAAALDPYADFGDVITDFSAEWGALPANGTTELAWGTLTFTGGTGTGAQVFEVGVDELDGVSQFAFDGTPAGSPIIVNVVGSKVAFGMNYASIDGVRVDDLQAADFGNAASRILWNFVDATSVDVTGTGQFLGSILAPHADATATASTNGRVYVGGDFTTEGTGNEQHNYPWIGAGPLTCIPTTEVEVGGFDAAKALAGDGAALVPDDTEFTLAYEIAVDGQQPSTGTLVLRADGTVVEGPDDLPVGAVVTLSETALPEIDGVTWGEPRISPNEFTIQAQHTVAVTVTNTANAVEGPVGGFGAQKRVTGPGAALVPADTEFTLAYSYELGDEPVTGSLVLRADGTVVAGPQNLPAGTTVSFTEIELPEVDGVVWGEPELSVAELVVEADANPVVILTNTANTTPVVPVDPTTPAGEIAHTGVDGLVPAIAAAALLLAAGLALVVVRRRRA